MNARIRLVPVSGLLVLALRAAAPAMAAPPGRWSLIPYPESVRPLDGEFEPRGGLRVVVSQPANRELHRLGELAGEILRESFGLRPALVPEGAGAKLGPAVRLSLVALRRGASAESYVLEVARDGVSLAAPSPAGLFYGLQTLRQIFAGAGPNPSIPAVRIEDSPRFPYRGIRLDSVAERLPVEAIERLIDIAARYKFNTLRWRLSGPAAWRLEALRYPLLSPGAGAAYSQEEVRQVILYARERRIEVVPEIDLARLGEAAEAAYPEIACAADSPCPTAAAIALAADLAGEIVELFPGRVLDLGGGVRPDTEVWRRVAGVAAARGRDVGLAGEPPAGAGSQGLVLFRQNAAAAAEAARNGFDVIVAGAAAGTIAEAYAFDPALPSLDAAQARRLRGADVALPVAERAGGQLLASAEALWSSLEGRDLQNFSERLQARAVDSAPLAGLTGGSPPPP